MDKAGAPMRQGDVVALGYYFRFCTYCMPDHHLYLKEAAMVAG